MQVRRRFPDRLPRVGLTPPGSIVVMPRPGVVYLGPRLRSGRDTRTARIGLP